MSVGPTTENRIMRLRPRRSSRVCSVRAGSCESKELAQTHTYIYKHSYILRTCIRNRNTGRKDGNSRRDKSIRKSIPVELRHTQNGALSLLLKPHRLSPPPSNPNPTHETETEAEAEAETRRRTTHREARGERLRQRAGLSVGAGARHAHQAGVRVGDAEAGSRRSRRRRASAEQGSEHLVRRGACVSHVSHVFVSCGSNFTVSESERATKKGADGCIVTSTQKLRALKYPNNVAFSCGHQPASERSKKDFEHDVLPYADGDGVLHVIACCSGG